jgi:hypothetical protein
MKSSMSCGGDATLPSVPSPHPHGVGGDVVGDDVGDVVGLVVGDVVGDEDGLVVGARVGGSHATMVMSLRTSARLLKSARGNTSSSLPAMPTISL